ncbi:MAG: kelch repeat-containing protein [Bacteroidota bacterium]
MKTFYSIVFGMFITYATCGQTGQWTWVKGSDTVNHLGNYGIQGVASVSNNPPARANPAYWTDLDGNFWMFGGLIQRSGQSNIILNDLWKFDPITEQWTWVHGPTLNTASGGQYGLQGIGAPTNLPPARYLGKANWTGPDGHLYMFGGARLGGPLNDLWKYDISLNQWTWLAGSSNVNAAVSYGTKGVPAITNDPGARYQCTSNWVADNKLWLLGGRKGIGDQGNDLWSYDITTNLWTWVSGVQTISPAGNYGTKGITNNTNQPPGRGYPTTWKGFNGDLYLFGGAKGAVNFNDVWRYNLASNTWTWVSGSAAPNNTGHDGGWCETDVSFTPRARYETGTGLTLNTCNRAQWFFGGYAIDQFAEFNDLWIYNSEENTWALVRGVNTPNGNFSYGTKGVPASTNEIPARGGMCTWTDQHQNLWVFGGYSVLNGHTYADLWKFTPDTSCINIIKANTPREFPTNFTICFGDTAQALFDRGNEIVCSPSSSSSFDATRGELKLYPTKDQIYNITITSRSDAPCPLDTSIEIRVGVSQLPKAAFSLQKSTIALGDEPFASLNRSTNAASYEWRYRGNNISTGENFVQRFRDIGTYCFELIAINDCGRDSIIQCGEMIGNILVPNAFSPNGDGKNDIFQLISSRNIDLEFLKVFNRWGQLIFETNNANKGWDGKVN